MSKVLKKADAVVIASNHNEFIKYDYAATDIKVLIDGKNCLSKSDFKNSSIVYRGIGV